MNLMETHFNIQRRLYDYQLALTRTPHEFDHAHQRFLALYNSTAHQGLLKERFASPIPLHVLGESKGRLCAPQELARKFAHALFVRTTNHYGCVTLHRSHFYVDEGLAQTPVLLWVAGEELRAVYDHVLLAEYTCHYDLRTGTGDPPAPRAVVSEPVCRLTGPGCLAGAHAPGLGHRDPPSGRPAPQARPWASRAVRALSRVAERLTAHNRAVPARRALGEPLRALGGGKGA